MDVSNFKKLSNSYHDILLRNLGWAEGGKGPYILNQVGYLPEDPAMKVQPFLLRSDGVWILSYRVACLPEKEQERCVYKTMKAVLSTVAQVGAQKIKAENQLPDGVTNEEALQRYKAAVTRTLARMQQAKDQALP